MKKIIIQIMEIFKQPKPIQKNPHLFTLRSQHYNTLKKWVAKEKTSKILCTHHKFGTIDLTFTHLPSIQKLNEYLEIPTSSLARAILLLELDGWLKKEGCGRRTTTYEIIIGEDDAKKFLDIIALPHRKKKQYYHTTWAKTSRVG